MSLAEILKPRADDETVVGKSGLRTAIDNLQEQFSHCRIDRVADEVGIQRLEGRFAGKNLGRHRRGMSHTRTADRFHQSFLDNALFDIQGQFAGALLGCTPAHAVRKAADIFDLFRMNPLSFFGNSGIFMTGNARAFGDAEHLCNIL